ncbi:phospholipase D-like domain-containing protein [Chitinophagaceae bacterium MMS25-I14]
MKKIYTLTAYFICMAYYYQSFAGNKIKVYFNHPVNTAVSNGVPATYLNNTLADTVVAYINKAKYSIDVAMYNYSTGTEATEIAGAVNAAYTRGVHIRWISDGSSTNAALSLLNNNIPKISSPTGGNYNIMHNKFMIIDAGSANADDAIVWTGSTNWSTEQLNYDYNNAISLQDSALAHAYTAEFNMMWGDTGMVYNAAQSKFGPYKTNLGRHNFTIDGHVVELYFSPSDGTNSQIQNAINTAGKDLYFGVYTFTDNTDATAIVNRKNNGVYVAGIEDEFSKSYNAHNTLLNGLGTGYFKVYNGSGNIYHSKMLIVDPSDKCSDPLVLTGSHNWSIAANTQNDENTLIIHSDTVANIYYQAFWADFTGMGGTLTPQTGCTTGITAVSSGNSFTIFPNPFTQHTTIRYELSAMQNVSITVVNIMGQTVLQPVAGEQQQPGIHEYQLDNIAPGIYFVKCCIGTSCYIHKVISL